MEDYRLLFITTEGIALPLAEFGVGVVVASCFFRDGPRTWVPAAAPQPARQIGSAPQWNASHGVTWQGD